MLSGATAMQLWGSAARGAAIEIFIEPTNANARNALRALASLDIGFATEQMVSDVAAHPVTVVFSSPPVEFFTKVHDVDWREAWTRAAHFQVEGVSLPTLSLADLMSSVNTGRPADTVELTVLQAIARRRADEPLA